MNKELDYELYVLAEILYTRKNKNISEELLFPNKWYSINNYKLKTEIINDALSNNCLIKDTKMYNEAINCIRLTNTLQ